MQDEYDAPPIAPTPAPAPGRAFPWRTANRVAAALVLFLAGAAAQTFRQSAEAPAAKSPGPRYALLLYEPPQSPDRELEMDVRELKDWVSSLRQLGHYVAAEHLALGALEVERDNTWIAWPGQTYGSPMLSGLFIISAVDEQEIIAIARSSPHVRHGGRVIVRPVEEI